MELRECRRSTVNRVTGFDRKDLTANSYRWYYLEFLNIRCGIFGKPSGNFYI